MSTPAIRRAGAEAAEAIARLHALSFTDAWGAASVARLIGGPGGFALLAEIEGEMAGFALLQCVPPEAELLSIGVAPGFRRSGLGRAILQRAARDLMAGGSTMMFLDVAADNVPALALYRALGFQDMSRRARYYGGTTDAIVMQAGLAGIAAET
jgi:[ribosomal protein S18]-alanine N-acetyltransferase